MPEINKRAEIAEAHYVLPIRGMKFELPGVNVKEIDRTYGEQIRRILLGIENFWMNEDEINHITTGLIDTISNAILYGNKGDLEKTIKIELDADDQELKISVTDQNPEAFDRSSIPDPTEGDALLSDHGRGLFMLEKFFFDKVEYDFENPGNKVTMIKYAPEKSAS